LSTKTIVPTSNRTAQRRAGSADVDVGDVDTLTRHGTEVLDDERTPRVGAHVDADPLIDLDGTVGCLFD